MVDLSPAAIHQARLDAGRLGLRSVRFVEGTLESVTSSEFELIIAIFFLHHLPDSALADLPRQVSRLLAPGACFYSLDPSRQRLSGFQRRL